jgi:hypothetical protein
MVPRRADYVPRGLDLDTVEPTAEIGGKVVVRAVEKRQADDCADRSEPLDCCGLSLITLSSRVESFGHNTNICSRE